MKVLVINGAPRVESGNTHLALNSFCERMMRQGAEVETVPLAGKCIKQCIGCFTCYAKTPGKCIHDDDMAVDISGRNRIRPKICRYH